MLVTRLPSGGCTVKFSFSDQAIVRSIGQGQIVKVRSIPTKRIAQQYEIIIRHDGQFESSYSIVDQTPHAVVSGAHGSRTPGELVEEGHALYEIRNGGFLHFQLFRAGLLVDPRLYMRHESDRAPGPTTQ
jgi:hypothetical protein